MKVQTFAIYDAKAAAYLAPFNMPTIGMAIRSFREALNNDQHSMSKTPSDYTLMHLGEFDDETAKFETTEPFSLGNGLEIKSQKEKIDAINTNS